MDEATAKLLGMIRDTLKELPGREVSAVRTAALVAMVQEDGHEACRWLAAYLTVGTGVPGEEVGTLVPAQAAASS
jgi:hypothetical protein